MPTIALEGTGASVNIWPVGINADIISIQMPERSREAIDTTHLGSLWTKTAKPSVLIDPGQVTFEVDHNPRAALLLKAGILTVEVRYPLEPGQSTPTKVRFSAFAVSEGGMEFTVGSRLTTKITMHITSDYTITLGA